MAIWTPTSLLPVTVELNLGGTWTDISTYALQREGNSAPITITRGRSNEQSSITPAKITMQWNNRDGRFSIRNPGGAYYGLLTRNTPVRASLPAPLNYMRIADDQVSGASCPGSSGLTLSADFDIRIDFQLDNWQPCFLTGQGGGTGFVWSLSLNGNGTVTLAWYDGTADRLATSSMPVPLGRSMLRCWFDPAGTSGSPQVLFYTAATMSGTQAQLGNAVPVTSGDYAAGQNIPLLVAYDATMIVLVSEITGTQVTGLQGAIYEIQVRNGSTLAADPVFSSQAAGTTSFTDGQGNTWTLTGSAAVSSRNFRGHAECTTLPQRWDNTGTDVWVPVEAAGVMRRIQQGSSPLPSAMRGGVKYRASTWGIGAYWPCEDNAGSTQIAAGISGIQPMQFSGTPAFQGTAGSPTVDSNFPGSAQLAQVQSSTWRGVVPVTSAMLSSTIMVVQFLVCIPSSGVTGTNVVLLQYDVGNGQAVVIGYSSAAGGTLAGGISTSSGITWQSGGYTGCNGQAIMIQLTQPRGSGNLAGCVQEVGQAAAGNPTIGASGVYTYSYVSSVIVNPAGASFGETEFGHLLVGYGNALPEIGGAITEWGSLLNAWQGETAANRVLRLCAQNGIAGRVYGYPSLSLPMGWQPIDTFANLLQYCETADLGQLYEPAEALGIGYRTLGSMCAQVAGLTLNYASQVLGDGQSDLEPEDDDQYTINDVTVSRNGGSSAQAQITSGPMSISAPPDGVGDYDTSVTLYHAWDADNQRIAAWMAWTGSSNVERYPAIPLHLGRPQLASLQATIAAMRIGDYFQVTSLPAWMPPGGANQLLYGYTETLGGFFWTYAINAVPEDPYAVAVAGSFYAESAGTTLATSYSSTASSLSVDVVGLPWITGTGLSIPIIVAGEEMTITAITGSSSPQAFTVTRSVNGVVKSQSSGASVSIAQPPVAALSGNR